ncbi:hypothetical protein BgAZ_403530 [Babesia gibsoni]|uniref:Uncharacterized protein n=1 Tax=Babesia gibsoni TaxID=33632 RepID=A0AAD8PCQ9_BABGI|nr:hypothetical protein BgAZ_403530 [Babesia gibsoni]
MNLLLALPFHFVAVHCHSQLGVIHRNDVDPVSHRFSQALQRDRQGEEPGLMSLLFHGKVTPRNVDLGLEDSNKGVKKEIQLNEAENHLNTMLNRLQEGEQNQLDAVQESFYLQNAQIDQIHRFINR